MSEQTLSIIQRMKNNTLQRCLRRASLRDATRTPMQGHQQEIQTQKTNLLRRPIHRQTMPSEQLQPQQMLQRRKHSGNGMTAAPDLEASIQQALGREEALTDNIRKSVSVEQGFGADFSLVKLHTDAQSHQLNQSIQAKAFTTGQDVFFRQGEYNPQSRGRQELIAHELTHVVQQNGSAVQAKSAPSEQLQPQLMLQLQPNIAQMPITHQQQSESQQTIQRFGGTQDQQQQQQQQQAVYDQTDPDFFEMINGGQQPQNLDELLASLSEPVPSPLAISENIEQQQQTFDPQLFALLGGQGEPFPNQGLPQQQQQTFDPQFGDILGGRGEPFPDQELPQQQQEFGVRVPSEDQAQFLHDNFDWASVNPELLALLGGQEQPFPDQELPQQQQEFGVRV
ncbi:MAG: DUF4157 domain-containing protein, partial [Nostoc sp. NMS4]|nr:DUF4157 domain-containing protein [Nostoc sp. NMS4]